MPVAGVLAIIGALTVAATSIIGAWRVGEKVDAAAKTNVIAVEDQSQKLNKIEVLVDGRYSEVLQELADVKMLLAKQTGREPDLDRAEAAQRRADDQHSRVEAANRAAGKVPVPKDP